MSSLVFRITGDPSAFKAAMGEVSGSLDGVGRKSDELSGKLGSLGTKLSLGLTAPVLALGASVIKTATDMDSLKRGLTAVAGSSEEAERQLKRLQEVAKLPGLGFRDAVEGSIRLQAAGFNAALAERSLKAFGNALATVGKGKAELDGVTLALSQIASKGKISAEEINQLAERVPQIRVAIKEAFGTADTEVLQKAGIKAEEFVTRVVAQLEKLKQVSGGPKNAFENLSDAVEKSASRIGEKFFPIIEATLPKLESLATGAADAVDAFLLLPEPIKNTAIALGALTLAAGPVSSAVSGVISAIGGIKAAAGVAGVAIASLFGAAVIASIAQTMTAIDQLNDRYKALAEFRERQKTGKEDLIQYKDEVVKTSDAAKRLGIDTKAIAAELNLFGGAAKKAASDTRDVTKELANASKALNQIKVDSVAGTDAMGNLSKSSLLYVELQERVKSSVSKVKDVMYEYITAGSIYGHQIETHRAPLTELAIAADDYRLALAKTRFELEALGKMPPLQMATPTQPTRRGTVFETDDIIRRSGGTSAREAQMRISQLESDLQRIKQLNQEGKATGNDVIAVQKALEEEYRKNGQAATISGKAQKEAVRQVSLVLTDLSRGITDVIFKGGKFGDMMKGVATEAAKSITRILIEGALMKLGKTLLGIGATSSNVFGGIANALGGLFGSGAKAGGMVFSAAGSGASAAGGLSGMLGGAGSAAGGASGAAGSIAGMGVSGIAGIVSGAASAISGIIGNFQMKGMNKSLDLIEKATRYTEAYALSILEKTNVFLPKLADIHDRLIEFRQVGIKLEAGGSLAMAGGGTVYSFDFSGATFGAGTSAASVETMFRSALDKTVSEYKRKGLIK